MTVASSNTRELSLDQLMRRSMQTAGIMAFEEIADSASDQWKQRTAFGRDQLDLVLDRLQAEGVILRDTERYSLTLTASVASYVLPSDTVDVHANAMYLEAPGETESVVTQVDRQEYDLISDKVTQGKPTRFWLERTGVCTVYLHQVPDTTNAVLYLRRKKMLADNTLGTQTPDLERYWHDYLHYELAYRYSIGLPLEERALLKGEAAEAKQVAQNYARQFVPNQIVLDHPTGWS